jgi:diacylglycerol kinase (ATP)
MNQHKFSLRDRIRGFGFAFSGLKSFFINEKNSWIHLFAAICVIVAGYVLGISTIEWIAIIFAIGLVVSLELVNSSVETLADFISPEKHEKIKTVKDLAAAGVLISAIAALVIGLIVFMPKIFVLIRYC